MAKYPQVSIIIPNWNGQHLLEKNLPSILTAKQKPGNHILEVIVVDDASSDTSLEFLKKNYPEVRLFRHRVNRGFSEAVNTGVRMAKGKLVCLLNTDVEVTDSFLAPVVKHFETAKVFAVSLHEEGFGSTVGKFTQGFVVYDEIHPTETSPSFWANGGSGVFSRSVWMKLKGMDSATFAPFYWEDIDLCYRAAKRGYAVLWEPRAHIFHKHESVINNANFNKKWLSVIKERNQLLFIWKNVTSPSLTRRHIRGLVARCVRHPGYLRVLAEAAKKLPVVRKARAKELSETTVSDEAIFSQFA